MHAKVSKPRAGKQTPTCLMTVLLSNLRLSCWRWAVGQTTFAAGEVVCNALKVPEVKAIVMMMIIIMMMFAINAILKLPVIQSTLTMVWVLPSMLAVMVVMIEDLLSMAMAMKMRVWCRYSRGNCKLRREIALLTLPVSYVSWWWLLMLDVYLSPIACLDFEIGV